MKKITTTIFNKTTPLWFRKVSKALTLLMDATILILLGLGYTENSLVLLIGRIGVPAILNTVSIFLTDETNE